MLHGLDGHPVHFRTHAQRLAAVDGLECWIPTVYQHGNCSLEEATAPLWARLQAFVARHGRDVPIVLVGVSNGGRIAANLEVHMRRHCANPVLLSTVATPYNGTKMLSWFGKAAKALGVWGRTIVNELSHKSPTCFDLVKEMRVVPTAADREYVFYAARHDWMVVPADSAHPVLGRDEEHVWLERDGHLSSIYTVSEQQCDRILRFIDRHASRQSSRNKRVLHLRQSAGQVNK